MTNLRATRVLCLLMFLFVAAAAFATTSFPAGARSAARVLALEIAPIQRDADYTKDHKLAYFNPMLGLIALGVGGLLCLAWLFGSEPVSAFRGDPLPRKIRARLDLLDGIRLSVAASVRAAKSHRRHDELSAEKEIYDRLSAAIDDVLDKIRQDLLLNSVDEPFLLGALDDLIDRGRSLSARLRRLVPVPLAGDDDKALLRVGHARLSRAQRGWERVFAAGPTRWAATRQLDSMRWSAWSRLEPPPR